MAGHVPEYRGQKLALITVACRETQERKELTDGSQARADDGPVSDVDRAKRFYEDGCGFAAEHDHQVEEGLRFVQLTPPGSACSIAIGRG